MRKKSRSALVDVPATPQQPSQAEAVRDRVEACSRTATVIAGILQLESEAYKDEESPRLDRAAKDALSIMAFDLGDELLALCGAVRDLAPNDGLR